MPEVVAQQATQRIGLVVVVVVPEELVQHHFRPKPDLVELDLRFHGFHRPLEGRSRLVLQVLQDVHLPVAAVAAVIATPLQVEMAEQVVVQLVLQAQMLQLLDQ
jgi:hypothetical protein